MIEGPLKSEARSLNKDGNSHLKEGVPPILACVGKPKDFLEDKKIKPFLSGERVENTHNVDYYGKSEELEKAGFKGNGYGYVISPIDDLDKYSDKYYDCTGLVFSGTEKVTGKNISFMSHQNPEYFLERTGKKFSDDLEALIRVIKDKCESGTIDAVIFGGRYSKVRDFKEPDPDRDMFINEYLNSINFLSERVKKEVGFEPLVIVGPKTESGGDYVYYDNEKRRLFLVRNTQKNGLDNENDFDAVQSFFPSELEERRKNWKPGEWGLPI